MKSHFLLDAMFPVISISPTESNPRFYFEPNKVFLVILVAPIPKKWIVMMSAFHMSSWIGQPWPSLCGPFLTLRLINWLFLSSKTWRFWNVSISIVSRLCNLLWLRLRHLSFGWSNPSNVFILLYDKSINFWKWSFLVKKHHKMYFRSETPFYGAIRRFWGEITDHDPVDISFLGG